MLERCRARRGRGRVVDWDAEGDDGRDERGGAVLGGEVERPRWRVEEEVVVDAEGVGRAEKGIQAGGTVPDDAAIEVAPSGAAVEEWREQVAVGRACARETAEVGRRENVDQAEHDFSGDGGEGHAVAVAVVVVVVALNGQRWR